MRDGTTRQRTGCLTCRTRKKRCDGVRSQCGHCQRLNLVCKWEQPRNVASSVSPHSNSVDVTTPSTNTPNGNKEHPSQLASIPKTPDPTRFWVDGNDGADEVKITMNRRLVLRYYMQTFTTILTTNLENNGFLSVLLPMAMESPPLLDTLIAWASSHLSLCHKSYQVMALQHRSSAISSFASSLSANDLYPERSLAGCMVLCSMESILGDTAGWYEHLVGASQIIRHAPPTQGNRSGIDAISHTLEGRWLLRNFAYHDILMSITLNRAPLVPGHYWDAKDEGVVDSYFGLASKPMILLSKISSLNADPFIGAGTSDSQKDFGSNVSNGDVEQADQAAYESFRARAFSIESELHDWTCEESQDRSLMSSAEAYRSAALIHLYRTMRRHLPTLAVVLNKKVARQVDDIVRHVSEMPRACLPECTVLFPLFMAGGEADCESHISCIRERMLGMTQSRHFQNVRTALSVLEELWRLNESATAAGEADTSDWIDILERRGWKLALS